MTKYLLILLAAIPFLMPNTAEATIYYADLSTTTCRNGSGGLTVATAWCSIDPFAEAARTAGDILFVRRDSATTTNISDINPTSDGTISAPLMISADYDNIWGDFSTSSQTYTVAVATSTFYASASTTGIVAGDWVYVEGDCFERGATWTIATSTVLNQCEFAYEVKRVIDNTLELQFPYIGNQNGDGKYLRKIGSNPQWNVVTGDFQWNFDTDDYWLVKGMSINGTDANGQVEIDSSDNIIFADTVFSGNSATVQGIGLSDEEYFITLHKCRFLNESNGAIAIILGDVYGFLYGSIISAVNTGNGFFFNNQTDSMSVGRIDNVYSSGDLINVTTSADFLEFILSNAIGDSNPIVLESVNVSNGQSVYTEDYQGSVGYSAQFLPQRSSDSEIQIKSTTSIASIRLGGGSSSIHVIPNNDLNTLWEYGFFNLFNYPIYTDTTSRQYDVYFRTATSTTGWTTNPTASELWIECEYWAHQTGATTTRKVKKSTGTIDFAGSSAWQALSVTCQPTQTGIMYLRGWYGKTKESSKTNEFLVDVAPVFSTP